jgi:hypothetical protein
MAAAVGLAVEGSARVYCFGWKAFDYRAVNSFHELGRSGLIERSDDPDLEFELKPNLDTLFKLVRFTTNSRGFRDLERPLTKPPGTFRIVLTGASYVMGAGVELEQSVSRRLEAELTGRRSGRVEVIQLAVGGYTPAKGVVLAERRALAYQPDLILVAVSPYQFDEPSPPGATLRPVRHAFFDLYSLRLIRAGFGRFDPPAGASTPPTDSMRGIDEIVSRLQYLRTSSGVRTGLVILEHLNRGMSLVPGIVRIGKARGVPIIDATRPFVRAGFPRACANPLDCHPNPWAHGVFAQSIGQDLVSGGLVPIAGPVSPGG